MPWRWIAYETVQAAMQSRAAGTRNMADEREEREREKEKKGKEAKQAQLERNKTPKPEPAACNKCLPFLDSQ